MSSSYDAPGGDRNAAVRPLRVLHVVAGNLYGGVETYLATVARLGRLNPNLMHAFAICYSGRLQEELVAAGAEVHELGAVRLSRPWTVHRVRSKLAKLTENRKIDAIVAHGSWPYLLCGTVAKRARARLVYFTHDDLAHPGWIDRLAARTIPDLVLANSQFTLGSARRLFPISPAEVCYLPVELGNVPQSARAEVRRDLGVSEDRVVLIQASRLERWKGHASLLAALGRMSQLPNWELWIAGGAQRSHEAAYLRELETMAEALGIGRRIRFLGQRSDVRRLLAAADIYCQANVAPEPFGIVFIEALDAGMPVVTSDFGGALEIVTDSTGILLPAGDVAALTAALCDLVDSPDRRRGFSAAGPARAVQLCEPAAHFESFARAISRALANTH